MKTRKQANGKKKPVTFDAEAFLNSAGVARIIMEFGRKETLFSQGLTERGEGDKHDH